MESEGPAEAEAEEEEVVVAVAVAGDGDVAAADAVDAALDDGVKGPHAHSDTLWTRGGR